MTEYSVSQLKDDISASPFIINMMEAANHLMRTYGKISKRKTHYVIFETKELDHFYKKIMANAKNPIEGAKDVEQFKRSLARIALCGYSVKVINHIGSYEKQNWRCGIKGCKFCGPHDALNYIKYWPETIGFAETGSEKLAASIRNSIMALTEKTEDNGEMGHFSIVETPTHDQRHILRLVCHRKEELQNPFTPDEDSLTSAYELIMEEYPFFEDAIDVGNNTYRLSKSGYKIDAHTFYCSLEHGRSGKRERGTQVGYTYNKETGQMERESTKERRQRKREERGIVHSADIPAFDPATPMEVAEPALKKTLSEISVHNKKFVLKTGGSANDMMHYSQVFMGMFIDNIKDEGYDHPYFPYTSQATGKMVEEFNDSFGIAREAKLDNIDSVVFEEKDLHAPAGSGLRARVTTRLNRATKEAQDKILSAMTIEEVGRVILKQLYDLKE